MPIRSSIDELAEAVRSKKYTVQNELPACFLWGAGCSKTGEVLLTEEWIADLKKRYASFTGLETFSQIVEELDKYKYREAEVEKLCEKAKINAAHLSLVELIRQGFIRHVASVNFDPLIERAAAFSGCNSVTVYDLASSIPFEPNKVGSPGLIYLHGRLRGFALRMTQKETEKQTFTQRLFRENRGAVWIIIGYSGKKDTLLPQFLEAVGDTRDMYWLYLHGYPDGLPSQARTVKIEGADEAMVRLCRRLTGTVPRVLLSPREHFVQIYRDDVRFKVGGLFDLHAYARRKVDTMPEDDGYDRALKALLDWQDSPVDYASALARHSAVISSASDLRNLATEFAERLLEFLLEDLQDAHEKAGGATHDPSGGHETWVKLRRQIRKYLDSWPVGDSKKTDFLQQVAHYVEKPEGETPEPTLESAAGPISDPSVLDVTSAASVEASVE